MTISGLIMNGIISCSYSIKAVKWLIYVYVQNLKTVFSNKYAIIFFGKA